jgi:hypothetical protein
MNRVYDPINQRKGQVQSGNNSFVPADKQESNSESVYEQVNREFACSHHIVAVYKKTMVNGTPMYGNQCRICGKNIGRIKKAELTDRDRTEAVSFDESLRTKRHERWLQRYEELNKDWFRRNVEKQKEERRRKSETWFNSYSDYLSSEKWRSKSQLVIMRDKICQACLRNPATQAHHKTYDNVGDEPLFDLVGVCKPCHEKLHGRRFNP